MELPLGELCRDCRSAIERRAGRVARWVAGASTLAMAVYVWLRMPPHDTARTVGIVGVLAWYLLTYLVAKRVIRELTR